MKEEYVLHIENAGQSNVCPYPLGVAALLLLLLLLLLSMLLLLVVGHGSFFYFLVWSLLL